MIMEINGYELIGSWAISYNSWNILARKEKNKYLLTKYGQVVLPNKDDSNNEELFNKLKFNFDVLIDYKSRLNQELKKRLNSLNLILLLPKSAAQLVTLKVYHLLKQ